MGTKKAFLLLNGHPPETYPNLKDFDLTCVVDGASSQLNSLNKLPDIICGDLDSISTENRTKFKDRIILTEDQEYTDFEKALALIYDRGITEVSVYGGSGMEQDHFLGNLSTALAWKNKLNLVFYDEYGRYFLLKKNSINRFDVSVNGIVSLIPLFEAKHIITTGLKYPLNNESLHFGSRIGSRNFATNNQVEITYKSGDLLLFIQE